MKLIIEKWLDTQTLPLTAEPLLADAITCYKSGAYRASMLMSYLGFLMIIKDRVMNGDRPAMLPLHKWNEKRTLLQNEDKWEAEINSALQKKEEFTGSGPSKTKTEDPFFYISEGLRQQLTYWKDRRNDCAHNKENIIIGAHIEAFWAFMISNLPKITLQGGMATLLQKLTSYYDPTQTPSGTPLMPILELISSSVETSKLDEFWNQAFTVID
ncbi:hypothetical protein BDD43_0611 [Mucilaginibacter gracilis]|uniref:Uncharacterized protein n=2 Tax=Mucilaginibacter TaxID=423349 RepID=H1YIM2_9SPHI|nr:MULTISPECIES: hypothetical protein [Mucilaginibacter]EHQ26588.1 hypothetical protein Mucpa_2467 [Mucilaginibacter paludis DSM 18603]RKR80491.1 hypothetical protein BDD43_0611 [Mucilaginibacter gracilis]